MTQMTKTLEQRIYDGNRAREALENEALSQVLDHMEQELIKAWSNSPARDEVGREKIYQYLMTLNKFKGDLLGILETGKLAELDLNHKRTLMERAKDGMSSFLE